MIRVFVSDIDGCVSEPYRPFDLVGMARVAAWVERSDRRRVPEANPEFSLCTGRAYAYTEAVSQALGLRTPVLFESGAGLFDPTSSVTRWHPEFTPELDRELGEVRAWLGTQLDGTSVSVDFAKRTQAGVIGPLEDEITRLKPVVREYVSRNHPTLTVFSTWISIDVLSSRLTKRTGLEWLSAELGVGMEECAFVGDTEGDLVALGAVGRSFAPANASPEVARSVQTVTRGRILDGVLEAYETCLRENAASAA